jgi:hypothetical protein
MIANKYDFTARRLTSSVPSKMQHHSACALSTPPKSLFRLKFQTRVLLYFFPSSPFVRLASTDLPHMHRHCPTISTVQSLLEHDLQLTQHNHTKPCYPPPKKAPASHVSSPDFLSSFLGFKFSYFRQYHFRL